MKTLPSTWEGAHLAYTLADEGGAASNLNNAYLFKAEDIPEITEDIIKKLKALGVELPDEGNTSLANTGTESASPQNVIKSDGDDMTPEQLQEVINKAKADIKAELQAEFDAKDEAKDAIIKALREKDEARELDTFMADAKDAGYAGEEQENIAKSWQAMAKVDPEVTATIIRGAKDAQSKVDKSLNSEIGHDEEISSAEQAKHDAILKGMASRGTKIKQG